MPLLCVSSPKGGVGKTTLAANLSAQLARSGRRIIALDLDPQNSLGLHFGMGLDRGDGFMSSLAEQDSSRVADWRAKLVRGPDGLHYLPFGHVDMEAANRLSLALTITPALLAGPIDEMLAEGALVVVDLPPGPSLVLPIVLPRADLLLVVLLVDATSIAQIPSIESGRAYGMAAPPLDSGRIGFVMNQLDLRTRLGRASVEAVTRHLGARLLGVIYRDENVPEAIASQALIGVHAQGSKAAQDVAALAVTIGPWLVQAGPQQTPPANGGNGAVHLGAQSSAPSSAQSGARSGVPSGTTVAGPQRTQMGTI